MVSMTPDEQSLQVDVAWVGTVAVLTATGEIDMATAPELDAALSRARDGSPAAVVVDLNAVPFLGSSGLAVLAGFQQRCQGVDVRLVARHQEVLRPLRMTKLDALFTLYDDRNEAIGAD